MSKLHQCPFSEATKCNLQDPCLDCETFAEHIQNEDSEKTCRRNKKYPNCPKEPSKSHCENQCGSWF